jgi:hypothetical protein
MKITSIKNRKGLVRKVYKLGYSIGPVKIEAEQGISHQWKYQSDFPDI